MTRNHLLFCVSVPGGSATASPKTPPCAALGAKNAKRRCRHNTGSNGVERSHPGGPEMPYVAAFSAPLPPTPRVLQRLGHPMANLLTIYGALGIPGRIRSLFTALWASQDEFARYLRHSGHPRASSLAVRGLPKPRFPKVPDRSRSAVLPLRRGWRSHMDFRVNPR